MEAVQLAVAISTMLVDLLLSPFTPPPVNTKAPVEYCWVEAEKDGVQYWERKPCPKE